METQPWEKGDGKKSGNIQRDNSTTTFSTGNKPNYKPLVSAIVGTNIFPRLLYVLFKVRNNILRQVLLLYWFDNWEITKAWKSLPKVKQLISRRFEPRTYGPESLC